MMGWTEDDEVLATTRFGPEVQRDYRIEGTAATAEEAGETTSPEPTQLPASGGSIFSLGLVLLASGLTSLGTGWAVRRRLAN